MLRWKMQTAASRQKPPSVLGCVNLFTTLTNLSVLLVSHSENFNTVRGLFACTLRCSAANTALGEPSSELSVSDAHSSFFEASGVDGIGGSTGSSSQNSRIFFNLLHKTTRTRRRMHVIMCKVIEKKNLSDSRFFFFFIFSEGR